MVNGHRLIVVGVDELGSDASRAALCWAVREARLRGCRLDVVTAWESSDLAATDVAQACKTHQRSVLSHVSLLGVDIRTHVVQGDPVLALTDAFPEAGLVVLGHDAAEIESKRHVRRRCVQRARSPVVVVPTSALARLPQVVVELRASAGDGRTLERAAREALLHSEELIVVRGVPAIRGTTDVRVPASEVGAADLFVVGAGECDEFVLHPVTTTMVVPT